MKRILRLTFFVTIFVLGMSSCGPVANATPIPTISLDVSETSDLNLVKASAVAVPSQEVQLSFVISGMVEDVAVNKGDQVSVGDILVTLDTSPLEYDLISAQAALTSAEIDANLQRQRKKKFDFRTFNFIYVSPPAEKILIADSKVEQMRSALEVVEASIAQGTLSAPFEGTVVEVDVSPGEYVRSSQAVVVIADLQNLRIETTDLSELNIASVEIGQRANAYIEALDKEFPGIVTAISPIANTLGGDIVFKVTIELSEQPPDLRWGMSADVEIDVE